VGSFLRKSFVYLALVGALLGLVPAGVAAPASPPGFNVFVVQEKNGTRFYRGGAPRKDTMESLARSARARGVGVTLVDLRKPAFKDDGSGKGGRLSPSQEEALAKKLGLRYVPINALDKGLPAKLAAYQKQGDIYMHCMYGVNRTGFATARFCRATGVKTSTEGLGKRDWKQGDAFEAGVRR
jgi:hypothetical protein